MHYLGLLEAKQAADSDRQLEVLEAACIDGLSLPDGASAPISPEAAFHELLRGSSVYEAAGTTLAPFKLERVSLPDSVHDYPQVADLLPEHARQYLEVPERMMRQDFESTCDIFPYIGIRPYALAPSNTGV